MSLALLLLLAAAAPAAAQDPPPPPPTPGVITATKSSAISIISGGLRCTVSTTNAGVSVAAYCYVGAALVFNSTAAILTVSAKTAGAGLSYFFGGDMITAVFWRASQGGPVSWEVVANGTVKGDVF